MINQLSSIKPSITPINKGTQVKKTAVSFQGNPPIPQIMLKPGFSLRDFKRLTPSERQELNASFDYHLFERHPFVSQKCSKEFLSDISCIPSLYKNDRKIALGRSPLWVVESLKYLDKAEESYKKVCFSAGWKNPNALHVVKKPSESQVKAYRHYLKELEMDPQSIVKNAREGHKTVLMDYMESGNGMRSFLELIDDWAKEEHLDQEVREALILHIFQHKELFKKDVSALQSKEFNGHNYATRIHRIEGKMLEYMVDSDHLGVSYPPKRWLELTPTETDFEDPLRVQSNNLIRFRIMDQLEQLGLIL